MHFATRTEAGRRLAEALLKYSGDPTIVYALPRGGVPVALEIAKKLHAPLDLIVARKIGHPLSPEYAIAAVAEDGHLIGNPQELNKVDREWLKEEVARQQQEAIRRRALYLGGRSPLSPKGKVALLIDDGIATGLTMRVAIQELRHRSPKTLVVAVPVAPKSSADLIRPLVDEVVILECPEEGEFLGAIGSYYKDFDQVSDAEVMALLKEPPA